VKAINVTSPFQNLSHFNILRAYPFWQHLMSSAQSVFLWLDGAIKAFYDEGSRHLTSALVALIKVSSRSSNKH